MVPARIRLTSSYPGWLLGFQWIMGCEPKTWKHVESDISLVIWWLWKHIYNILVPSPQYRLMRNTMNRDAPRCTPFLETHMVPNWARRKEPWHLDDQQHLVTGVQAAVQFYSLHWINLGLREIFCFFFQFMFSLSSPTSTLRPAQIRSGSFRRASPVRVVDDGTSNRSTRARSPTSSHDGGTDNPSVHSSPVTTAFSAPWTSFYEEVRVSLKPMDLSGQANLIESCNTERCLDLIWPAMNSDSLRALFAIYAIRFLKHYPSSTAKSCLVISIPFIREHGKHRALWWWNSSTRSSPIEKTTLVLAGDSKTPWTFEME